MLHHEVLQIAPRLDNWFLFYLIVHYAITECGRTELDGYRTAMRQHAVSHDGAAAC